MSEKSDMSTVPSLRAGRLSRHICPAVPAPEPRSACGAFNSPIRCRCDRSEQRERHHGGIVANACNAVPTHTACDYDWRGVHNDLEKNVYAGAYGWDHSAYWAISELKAGVDLSEWYKTRTEAEFYLPEFKELADHPETQSCWHRIATFDPMGMTARPPTIAACKAKLDLPELKDLKPDGKIVLDSLEIVTSKCAVNYAWNLPLLSQRLKLTEKDLRQALHKYSRDDRLLDPAVRTFIPAVGGATIYTFGDARMLRDPRTETVVRVHDECIGSDVFGSDICSCRPYLIFALRQAVECAQRGGVGIVVYFRKEGRSLGEVVKFRVYNARTNQEGGDRPETYFHHTEAIAGIRDARFQVMMPDVLNWMGLRRIDLLCSMSNEKYQAIVGAGIQVMQRVDLPEDYVKASMRVELDAKIASGYHSDKIETEKVASELMQLSAIRRQCGRLYDLAKQGQLDFFTVHEEQLSVAVDATEKCLRGRFPHLRVPPHSRLRHFDEHRISAMMGSWACDQTEKARRMVDLVTVSVLLDAGAGSSWRYIQENGATARSSEGLAAATLDLFSDGFFSTDPALKTRVNSLALKGISEEALSRGLQVSRSNPLVGVAGRVAVLRSLGQALEDHPEFFGRELPRPGNMVDYLLGHTKAGEVSLDELWKVCALGLYSIWPLHPNGVMRGDVWKHSRLQSDEPSAGLVPFHKLTQWLTYSLIDVLDRTVGLRVTGTAALTCLAEYRNGGLLIDTGVLSLKDPTWLQQEVNVGTELAVEWRALTVVLIDRLAGELRRRLGLTEAELPLAAVLEGGTWHAGRQVAATRRQDGTPPIRIRLTGDVF